MEAADVTERFHNSCWTQEPQTWAKIIKSVKQILLTLQAKIYQLTKVSDLETGWVNKHLYANATTNKPLYAVFDIKK